MKGIDRSLSKLTLLGLHLMHIEKCLVGHSHSNLIDAVMDLPAQQHHINVCLDGGGTAASTFQDTTPAGDGQTSSSACDAIKAWLESLGLGHCYSKFKAVSEIAINGVACFEANTQLVDTFGLAQGRDALNQSH